MLQRLSIPFVPFSKRMFSQSFPKPKMSVLGSTDPILASLISQEESRQKNGLELIASENFTSAAVRECLGSCLTNKYSEGLPGKRYYGGNEFIDQIERLCQRRAFDAFHLDPSLWGVNVQAYSGSVANLAAYNALLKPHDRLMGLGVPSGGHLTHGFYAPKRRVSVSSIFYESFPYQIDEEGEIDYEALERQAKVFAPKLIICGYSAYPRDLDYAAFRKIADSVGAYLLADISHIAGFVATGLMNNPFPYCDIVTTTTHKTLRGPRSALIFGRSQHMDAINFSVFPGIQGGPHNHQIAAVATQLREVATSSYVDYMKRVRDCAQRLGESLSSKGYDLVSGGTSNHLILVCLKDKGLTGSKVEKLCDEIHLTLNKNSVRGDTSALSPGGIRLGTAALATRGMGPEEMEVIGSILDDAISLAQRIQAVSGRKLVDFVKAFEDPAFRKVLDDLRQRVHSLASDWPSD